MDVGIFQTLPQWPRFLGPAGLKGDIRLELEDFRVDEIPATHPSGEGDHLWLQVCKRGANTEWIASALAQLAGCAPRDVGFAGMKDRHAVTTQWFSLPLAGGKDLDWQQWHLPEASVLQAARHGKKLKRGVLNGNRFGLLIRNLQGDLDALLQRLERVRARGIPNYFGAQRFGHGGHNTWRGVRWLMEGGRLQRSKKSIYLSAVRSFLFNQVLAQRVLRNDWDQVLDGEVVMLNGSHSVFLAQNDESGTFSDLVQRCREFDLHPTGPLPGDSGFAPVAVAAEVENSVLEPYQEVIEALQRARVDAARRSLRLRVRDLAWTLQDDCLSLEFELPPGAYATTVLDELVSTGK